MSSTPTRPILSLLRRLVEWPGPNLVLTGFIVLGVIGEIFLLRRMPDNAYEDNWRVVLIGTCMLVWFWWTLIWLFWGGLLLVRRLTKDGRPLIAWPIRTVAELVAATGIVAYVSSWGLYFRSGRFSNIEAVLFGWENLQTEWFRQYLLQSESHSLIILAGAFLGAVLLVPLLAWLAGRAPVAESNVLRSCSRACLWLLFTFLLMQLPGRLIALQGSLDKGRRDAMLDVLKNRTHPFFTMLTSLIDLSLEEPIEPCLDEALLRPRTKEYRATLPNNPPSVIFVAVESLRHDLVYLKHQGREVTPHLNALARKGLNCTRAYSQSTHSDYADVCIVSSLYPLRTRRHHYYRTSDPWPKALIYDLLKPLGYSTAIISSQNERWGSMDRFLESPHLDLFYDAERSQVPDQVDERDIGMKMAREAKEVRRGKLTDRHTTDTAIQWIEQQTAQGKPFYLSLNLQTSHFPYTVPPGVEEPFQPATIDFDASFLHYPPEKLEIVRNAYFNAIRECDRQVGRLVEALKKTGRLDNTILVVFGENGEAFHENGTVTHAREPVEPALRVACVFHHPGKLAPRAEDYPVELVDVVPTVFGLMGLPPHDNFQGIDFLARDRESAEKRLLFFHVENGLSRSDAVLLGGRWKLHLDRNRGRTQLFDVKEDPGEADDLSDRNPELARELSDVLLTWRRRQLAYHHFPHYYQHYHPPRPPRWGR